MVYHLSAYLLIDIDNGTIVRKHFGKEMEETQKRKILGTRMDM